MLGIRYIRFKHGVIRWHTLAYADIRWGRKLLVGMFKNCVRIPTYVLYAKHTLEIRWIRYRGTLLIGWVRWLYADILWWRCTIQLAYWWRYHNIAYENNVWVVYDLRMEQGNSVARDLPPTGSEANTTPTLGIKNQNKGMDDILDIDSHCPIYYLGKPPSS